MEGERRKRKMEREEESEEEQMQKFFAMIKSTKDARDRLCREKEEEKAKRVWKPSFKVEDFMNDEELAKINTLHRYQPAPGPSGKETEEETTHKQSPEEATTEPQTQPEKPTHDLDLTLSL
ncbi:unnamed protein product [Sphenostylis stenocarpa]|uniref:Uncharacterized protein n=1 Tax=Sphenostylis stenocarpa TaxID=92480 RepID=A0AA86W4K3_9FABA|nr:unnamed protein product [Sphenostylis stenocarpa]